MKKYILLLLVTALLSSCNKFLDTDNYTRKDSSNFPQSREELENALVGVYNVLKSERDSPLLWGSIMSDECFGNGGAGDGNWQGYNRMLRFTNDNEHSESWSNAYQGIWRCNSILEIMDRADSFFTSAEDKNKFLGQIYFLRAHYYFTLAKLFGPNIPLRLKATVENLPAATAEQLYAQIGDDINKAVSLLPSTPIHQAGVSNYGRVTRWAAEALAGRIFQFYTGYYRKAELPTLSGSINKQQVVAWLQDCVQNSGHRLLPDYRNNYHYANDYTNKDYPYAKNNKLNWIGDGGNNTEAVFVIKFSIFTNSMRGQIYGMRNQPKAKTYPFRDGWGATSVNPKFFEQWKTEEANDIRRNASIIDVTNPEEGLDYKWFVDQGEETGFFVKKFMDVNGRDATGKILNFSMLAYGFTDRQNACAVDWIEIRFSDVLLMLSELTQDATYLNMVRSRVGLSPAAYTLENLQKERKHELAFEGYRYWDLLRWYPELTTAGVIIDANQKDAVFYRNGEKRTMQTNLAARLPQTGGYLPLPLNEIQLSDGVLKQNQGWVGSAVMYQP